MEPDRFTELYRRHHRAVWAYAVRRLPPGTDAGDVAAEVCSTNAVSLRLARARKRLGRELAHLMSAEERIR